MKTILAAIWPDWIYQQLIFLPQCWHKDLLTIKFLKWNMKYLNPSSVFIFTHCRSDERISRISSTNYRNSLTKAAWVILTTICLLINTNLMNSINKLSLTVSDYRRLSSLPYLFNFLNFDWSVSRPSWIFVKAGEIEKWFRQLPIWNSWKVETKN